MVEKTWCGKCGKLILDNRLLCEKCRESENSYLLKEITKKPDGMVDLREDK